MFYPIDIHNILWYYLSVNGFCALPFRAKQVSCIAHFVMFVFESAVLLCLWHGVMLTFFVLWGVFSPVLSGNDIGLRGASTNLFERVGVLFPLFLFVQNAPCVWNIFYRKVEPE